MSEFLDDMNEWETAVKAFGLSAEREDDPAKLRGLLWYAWHEFNAIRARSGAPLDHQGMTLCTEDYWDSMTESFAAAIGEEARKPWPSEEAKRVELSEPRK